MTAAAVFAPTTDSSSSRVARSTPARLPNARSEQREATAWTDPRHFVQFRPEVAHRTRFPVVRDGEVMGLVADPLHQQQCRIVFGQHDRLRPFTREEHFLSLGNANGYEIAQA